MTFGRGRIYPISLFLGCAFLVFVAFLVAQTALSPDQSIGERAFFLAWLIVMSYGLYQHLYRIAYELKCTDNLLIWKSPLRSGTVPLSALRRIYSRGGTLGVIEMADGSRIQIYAQKGFLTFVSGLAERNPNIDVRLNWYIRFIERFPGRTLFHP